jgi:hypothetical protein
MTQHPKLSLLQISILTGVLVLFQNCSQVSQFDGSKALGTQSLSMASTETGTDTSHPDAEKVQPTSRHIQIVNKTYVGSIIMEVFTSTTFVVPNLVATVDQWVTNRGTQFGSPCDPYSSYSGKDCGGSITNSQTPANVDDNTLREAFHIQLCENVLGVDQAVGAALQKISAVSTTAPTLATVRAAYGLFYRADGPTNDTVSTLMAMDASLAANNEPMLERWRGILLQICESPGWELQ